MTRRTCCTLLILAAATLAAAGQERSPVDRAKDVFQQLNKEDFKAVAAELNAQMSAAISEPQLRDTWAAMLQQTGPFKAFIDDRVATPAPGITAVMLGCQFERAAVNMAVTFDADGKIAGLRLMPRQ
jgi:hypothetical protein